MKPAPTNMTNKLKPKAAAPARRAKTPPVAPEAGALPVPPSWSWLAAIIGGLCGALAFDPLALRWLAPLAPLGCFLAIRWAPTPRGALLRAWAFGWVFFFGTLHWLLMVAHYAEAGIVGVLGVLLLGVYLGLYPALAGYVARRWAWPRGPLAQFAAFGSLWLLVEWIRTLGRLGMSLAQIGHAWAVWPGTIQIAQWLGELGVSLEVLWLSGLIFLWSRRFWLKKHPDAPQPVPPRRGESRWLLPTLTLVPLLWVLFSFYELKAWDKQVAQAATAPGARTLHVALVQPNINQDLKLKSYSSPDANEQLKLSEMITATQEKLLAETAKPGLDFAVLSETAFSDFYFSQNLPLQQRAGAMAKRAGVNMLFGASRTVLAKEPDAEGNYAVIEAYNSAYLAHKDGQLDKTVYDKMRLVPFGECVPYFGIIPGFADLIGIGSFDAGKTQKLFETKGLKFGVLICFESTFSQMGRGLAREGADFLAVITNDAWYGLTAGGADHHNVSLLRAVETRRPLLRCANTGISSIISPAGRIVATLGLGKQGVVEGTIAPLPGRSLTWFVRFGNAWLALPALWLLGLIVTQARRRRVRLAQIATTLDKT